MQARERTYASAAGASENWLRENFLAQWPEWLISCLVWEQGVRAVAAGRCRTSDAADRAVAYAQFYVDPEFETVELGRELIQHIEQFAHSHCASNPIVEITIDSDDAWQRRAVETADYGLDREFLRMSRSRSASLPESTIAPGFQLREYDRLRDLHDWVALYRRSFRDHHDYHDLSATG